MPTPLYTALSDLAMQDTVRFHMPGHKGEPVFQSFADVFALDYTETYGTGNLYTGEGPIREAEALAAKTYGADDCFFLTGGSTQGIHAMLACVCPPGGEILLDRNCHKSVLSALAMLDLSPTFIYPQALEPFGIPTVLPPAEVEAALDAHPNAAALLVTSPNYYGVMQNLAALADLCHARGKLLLVDAAHGAHFPALGLPSPIEEGADVAVLSAHKTLPTLGQSAFLLMRNSIDCGRLRECTALCGTSSPSYPMMVSMDLAREWLSAEGGKAYRLAAKEAVLLREAIAKETPFLPFTTADFPALDPCRLVLSTAGTDLTGNELSDLLYSESGIACEMADARNIVLILSGTDTPLSLVRLAAALRHISRHAHPAPLPEPLPPLPRTRQIVSVRQALFSSFETVPIAQAAGRICARPVTPYPPGVPLIYPGEEISTKHIELFTKRCYTMVGEISVLHK